MDLNIHPSRSDGQFVKVKATYRIIFIIYHFFYLRKQQIELEQGINLTTTTWRTIVVTVEEQKN